jgi:hypothetical protein
MNVGVNNLPADSLNGEGNSKISGSDPRMKRVAEILSVVFHPLFIPLYGLLIIYSSQTLLSFIPSQVKRMILILVTTNNVLLPMALAAVLWAKGAIISFSARGRNERVLLLTFALIMYGLTAFVLLRMQVPNLFKAYFISIAVVTLVTLFITPFYRISLHATGFGGLLMLIVFMIVLYHISMVWQIIAVFLTCGAVMSARIYLKDHAPSEVWTGFLAGAAVMGLSLLLLLK